MPAHRLRFLWIFLLPLICGNTFDEHQNRYLAGPENFIVTDSATSGSFSVISYNIAGLPELISSAKTRRAPSIREIGKRLGTFDIAHVQEDFNYNRELFSDNQHVFRTHSKGKIPFGDGLNTLSKFPIRLLQRFPWNDCTGADCLTPKGFTFSRIEVARNVFIDFYNVHANAYNHISATAARRRNLLQLSDFITKNSAGNAVVVMGDLNARYAFSQDNVHVLANRLGLQDAWILHENDGMMPAASPVTPAKDILSITGSTETIDKILYRSSTAIQLSTSDYELESALFSENGLPLSDHHPVSATFHWQVRRSPEMLVVQAGTHSLR